MGLLSKIKKSVTQVAGTITSVTTDSIRTAASRAISDIQNAPENANRARIIARDIVTPATAAALNFKTGGVSSQLGANELLNSLAGIKNEKPEQENQDVGNFLGGLAGVLGQLGKQDGSLGAIGQIGGSFLSGFLPAQGPVRQQPTFQFPGVQAQPVMAVAPIIRGAASAVASFVAPILAKMSQAIGKNVSLRAAMIIIRRLGKFLQSPSAIAGAVGLSVSELSQLLTAASLAGSSGKRMNVGNVKALRRAHRRIKGFHKLCGDNDNLKAPRRRSAPRKSVVICK